MKLSLSSEKLSSEKSSSREPAAFDRPGDTEGDGKDFKQHVAPYAAPVAQETYRLLRDVGFRTPLESRQPSASMQVLICRMRPGTEPCFEAALRAALRVLEGTSDARRTTCGIGW